MSAEPMHFGCVCCHAHADSEHDAVEHVLVILIMLERGELEEYKQALCFAHRRRLEEALGRGDPPGAG